MHAEDADRLPDVAALRVHDVVHMTSVTSTMDEAHARAARGASAGTLIVADQQTAGRGRGGNSWHSELGMGVFLTLIERPTDAAAVDVLSIRLGLAISEAMQPLSAAFIQLKWPNDLYLNARKLGGILVEARWREGSLDWVAIGVGINLAVPANNGVAAALCAGTTRNDVLLRLVPALRHASAQMGSLTIGEQKAWTARDLSVGRQVVLPLEGTVLGIALNGALRVQDFDGVIHEVRTGSLVFADL